MLTLYVSEIANIVEGQIKNLSKVDFQITNLSTDSRINGKDLFIALVGKKYNGNDFLEQAVDNGYKVALVSEYKKQIPIIQILVDDTLKALHKIAKYIRLMVNPYVIAITGSSGKTSTKEMLANIFITAYGEDSVLYTQGNLNNEIGVALTLCGLTFNHKVAIVEQGANHKGEIDYTGKIVLPNVSILNNVHFAHLEGFGSIENVALAKDEVFNNLSANGTRVVNIDDENINSKSLELHNNQNLYSFAINNSIDSKVFASDIQLLSDKINFVLNYRLSKTEVCKKVISMNTMGIHNVYNALAASAASLASKLSFNDIAIGLGLYRTIKGRLYTTIYNKLKLIDDSYNANMNSMITALDVLSSQSGKKILVIADMAELGDNTKLLHIDLAHKVNSYDFDIVLTMGDLSRVISDVCGGIHFNDINELIHYVDSQFSYWKEIDSVMLIKASRGKALDRLSKFLEDKYK